MCGRYSSRLPPEYFRSVFRTVGAVPDFEANYNVVPTQDARRLDLLRWGDEKDPKGGRTPINARAETAATSGVFRSALAALPGVGGRVL
jgi:putative SOS response-associated peptidase YedK